MLKGCFKFIVKHQSREGEIFDDIVRNEVQTAIDIDGAEKTNDAVKGKGAYTTALCAMAELAKKGVLNCLATTLTNATYKDFGRMADLVKSMGARLARATSFRSAEPRDTRFASLPGAV